jgi:large subunit ribosomal protein L19
VNIVDQITREQMKAKEQTGQFKVGDTVRVHFRIVEGEKERTQVFEGTVIGRNGGDGPQARFTVRRLAYGEGVERIFPLHSPRLEKVEVVRQGTVRRAKLNYLRDRAGRAARVKAMGRSTAQDASGQTADSVAPETAQPTTTPEA